MGKRLKIIIPTLIGIVLIGVASILLYVYWPAITGTINSKAYLSADQGQAMYDQGFMDGSKNYEDVNVQLKYYQDLVDEYYLNVDALTKELNSLKTDNSSKESIIKQLTALKEEQTSLIESLQATQKENEQTIVDLKSQIETLKVNVSELERAKENSDTSVDNLNNQIDSLNQQIRNLQAMTTQLEQTNALNIQTINSLNQQIVSLNNQITELTLQLNSNSNVVSGLNSRISELEKSIEYYESYIKSLESGNTIVITFEFDGSVINVQTISKNSKALLIDPVSTDYIVFNYWTVDGEQIDLNNYEFVKSTKVVANVTYKYDVKFKSNNSEVNSQIVEQGKFATKPSDPKQDGYDFDGWTLNGVDVVDVDSTAINESTIFIAKFTKLHTVKFMYEDQTLETRQVRNGECTSVYSVVDTTYKKFKGWTLNGVIVNVAEQKIVSDTTFVASITYYYDVYFDLPGEDGHYNSQIVVENGYPVLPDNPSREHYSFKGWTLNGIDVTDPLINRIDSTTIYIAKFVKTYIVKFFVDDVQYESDQIIEEGNYASLPNNPIKDGYKFEYWTLNGNDKVDVNTYNIVGDTLFIAKFVRLMTFADLSWSTIDVYSTIISSEALNEQQIADRFNLHVGDERTETFIDGCVYKLFILGFNHDNLTSGGKAGISISLKDCYDGSCQMFQSQSSDSWEKSVIRTTRLPVVCLANMPVELQNVIKFVNKKASTGGPSPTIVTTSDKLWLFSVSEVFSKNSLQNSNYVKIPDNLQYIVNEGEQYAYFKYNIGDRDPGHGTDSPYLTRYRYDSKQTGAWVTRTAAYFDDVHNMFYSINKDGLSINYANQYSTFSFGFCI